MLDFASLIFVSSSLKSVSIWAHKFGLRGEAALGEKGKFKLSLGVDENVKVKRSAHAKEEKKGFFSSDRRRKVTVNIELKNMRDENITCKLEEMLPHIVKKGVSVKLTKEGTTATVKLKKENTSKLIYTVKLKKGETKTITYTYEIIHPKKLKLQGFKP